MTAAALFSAFLILLGAIAAASRATAMDPELARKALHVGCGLLALSLPWLVNDSRTVLALAGGSLVVLAAIRRAPALRVRLGVALHGVGRDSRGDLYFPLTIALLFPLAEHDRLLLFVVPMLTLTFADTAGALVGRRYGRTRYPGSQKTLEGSLCVGVVAFTCCYLPLRLGAGWDSVNAAPLAWVASIATAVVEASADRGLDNLLVPIVVAALLYSSRTQSADELFALMVMMTALGGLLCLQTRWSSLRTIPNHTCRTLPASR